ncbi:MAG: phage tail protein [Arthrospira sp. SH-MAG29]|nr:phage tail protein [Arthrospira sp. SH-MAG29]MBS0015262.1 phage tail protein [Arthrospira sp. SH-MAG29]
MAYEYLTSARFYFEFGNNTRLLISKVSGVSISIDPAAEGQSIGSGKDVRSATQITPASVTFENMTLEFITTAENDALVKWYLDCHPPAMLGGKTDAIAKVSDASLVLYKQDGSEGARWNLRDCLPAKYTTTQASSDSTDLFKETIEISHSGLQKVATLGTSV